MKGEDLPPDDSVRVMLICVVLVVLALFAALVWFVCEMKKIASC